MNYANIIDHCISECPYVHLERVSLWDKRGTCIKGLIGPPSEPKTESCFSQISFDCFIRRMTEMLNFDIYFNFTVAMVTKMAAKIGIK